MSLKTLREQTIGKALTMTQLWAAQNRGPTSEEFAAYNALLDSAEAGLNCGPIPRANGAFAGWVRDQRPDGLSAQLQADAIGGGRRAPGGIKLFDERGRCFRGLTKEESFADAVREQSRGGTSDQDKMIADGLTFGGLMRAAVLGPSNAVEKAALSGGSGTGGGLTVPTILAGKLIDKLVVKTQMLNAGAVRIPLDSDTHTFVRVTGHPTAAWRQEGGAISLSDPSFGAMTFRPRSLAVIVKVTRELLQDSLNVSQAIERAFTDAFSVEVDRVGLLGSGAAAEPMGLVNEPGINAVAAVGAITSYAKILDAYKLLLDDNAPDPTAVIMANREWRTFAGLVDTTGQPLMRPEAIDDLPFLPTSSVPTNQGGGANESTMFMGHYPDFAFGIRSDLQIEILRELFAETHHYGFAAHLRLDTGVFHAESFCKLSGITP
jgi:HK97 family phage major capsid protein